MTRPKLIEIDEDNLPALPPRVVKPSPPNICFVKANKGIVHIAERVYSPGEGSLPGTMFVHAYCGGDIDITFRIRGRSVGKHTICKVCRKNALVDLERYERRMRRYKELCLNSLNQPIKLQHKYQCPACGLMMQPVTTRHCVCQNQYCKKFNEYQIPLDVPPIQIDTD